MEIKGLNPPLVTTEKDSADMTVKDKTQIREDGFTLLLAALVYLKTAARTRIVIQILGDTFATRDEFM